MHSTARYAKIIIIILAPPLQILHTHMILSYRCNPLHTTPGYNVDIDHDLPQLQLLGNISSSIDSREIVKLSLLIFVRLYNNNNTYKIDLYSMDTDHTQNI